MNPLEALISDALDIKDALRDAVTNLELAIEADHKARRTAKEAMTAYDNAEAEWEYDQMCVPENGTKITADVRKAMVASAKVKAQRDGALAGYLAMANAARYNAEDAAMALLQAEKRYGATRSACDLTAAILNAAK
ncbi:MAG: hypothetical protein IPM06_19595 [Rhizobiales bacterium]|nr:hypothetical protein [Hyphomicrobiales bacterium]